MKGNNELENFIKSNYNGSIITFEEDVNRFMILKRIFKKHALRNLLLDSDRHILICANHIRVILNCFNIKVANKIFVLILEPNELTVWYSFSYVLQYNNISYDKPLETFLQPYFKDILYV